MRQRFYLWTIARLVVALLVVGWAYSYLLPDSGEKEFARAQEALKSVSAVHYELVADRTSMHQEDRGDLVCADDTMHRTSFTDYKGGGTSSRYGGEVIRIGHEEYKLQSDGYWKRGYPNLPPNDSPRETCKRLQENGNTWFLPDFDRMAKHGVIGKKDKKTLPNGEVCQQWRVTFLTGPIALQSSQEHRIVCLGVKDHLPKEMTDEQTNAHWIYAFNLPLKIEAPTDLAPGVDVSSQRMNPGENLYGPSGQ